MLKKITDGICAGIMITIGGAIFLACENRYVGAVLFSVALLCICMKGYSLFTGKIGYIAQSHKSEDFSVLLLGLFGNAIGTIIGGYAIRLALPKLGETALTICNAKLDQNLLTSTSIRAFFCGVLMYLAVSIYKEKLSIAGIVFCIPVFILAGFEHSIADIFYFATSGIVSLKAFVFIVVVILGNALGSLVMCALTNIKPGAKKDGE